MVIGESGTGKTTSMRNLDPASTYLIKIIDKPLPFRKSKEMYGAKVHGNNSIVSDNADSILEVLERINKAGTHIKTVVIDDFQYLMANEFMRRSREKGYEKFTQIAENAWRVIFSANTLRDDLVIFFLSHSEVNDAGITKIKTIGKLLDEKITVEGLFTIVLQTLLVDGKYMLMTKNNGHNTIKSPMEMFSSELIENDLVTVITAIKEY